MKTLEAFGWGLLAFAVLGVAGFFITDCAGGQTRYWEVRVVDKIYKPAYTTTSYHTDSDGNLQVSTTRHPEEYHVICGELGGFNQFDCSTDAATYHSATNGQIATVKTRQGGISGVQWLPRLQL